MKNKVINFNFACKTPKGFVVIITLPVQVAENTTNEHLKEIIDSYLKMNNYSWNGHNDLEPVDAYPANLMDCKEANGVHFVDATENRKFIWEVNLIHPKNNRGILCRTFREVTAAPYVLNQARIKYLEEVVCPDLIQQGYQVAGLEFCGEEPLSGTVEDMDMVKDLLNDYSDGEPDTNEEEENSGLKMAE